jgi:hypothetical protein
MAKPPMYCTTCGTFAKPKRIMKGSILTEFVLWCLFLLPGLIYSIWRHTTVTNAGCPACGSSPMVPATSPIALRASAEAQRLPKMA